MHRPGIEMPGLNTTKQYLHVVIPHYIDRTTIEREASSHIKPQAFGCVLKIDESPSASVCTLAEKVFPICQKMSHGTSAYMSHMKRKRTTHGLRMLKTPVIAVTLR